MKTGNSIEIQKPGCESFALSGENTSSSRVISPRADIYERENDIVLLADMPGTDEASIEITVEKNILSIKGSVQPQYPEAQSLTYCEYGLSDYERKFILPNETDRDGISATLKNGVLKLILPKSVHAKAKRIVVNTEA